MKTLITLLALLATPTTLPDMNCANKLAHRTNPYACFQKSYISCMACLDRKATACREEMQSSCGLNWTDAKEQCAWGNYYSEQICFGDFEEVNQ